MSSFVSYSRADQSVVMPLVLLLRTGQENIFCDQDSIAPGKKWREQIEDAIARSERVIIFWSVNSSASREVGSELELALSGGKDIVPVLLDDAPLLDCLLPYQWIDARGYAQHLKPTLEARAVGAADPVAGFLRLGLNGLAIGKMVSGVVADLVSNLQKEPNSPTSILMLKSAKNIAYKIAERIGEKHQLSWDSDTDNSI